jgi:catechol 2,3-dioxygenase-like lactoylglutathione lyase family enzyme
MKYTFTHFRLLVNDYASCYRFYSEVIGLTPVWGDETTLYCEFETGDVRLALFDRKEMASVVGTSDLPADVASMDSGTLILRVDNVDETCVELQSKGVEVITQPTDRADWSIRTAHFRDPGGNLIEINCKLD